MEGRSNADVEVLIIVQSNTPFMIQQIFTTFTNIAEILIESSNLQSISIPNTVQLTWVELYNNNIARIDSDSFRGQQKLQYFYGDNNNIREIAEDAFEGLIELQVVSLINNRISNLAPKTLQPLTKVFRIDLERNYITSIDENVFSNNLNLESIFLEFNQIREIHPQFAANLRDKLAFINLNGNQCVRRIFTLASDESWRLMNVALQTCFNNFHGTVPEDRSAKIEFTGNLSIFDEFGNLIARV